MYINQMHKFLTEETGTKKHKLEVSVKTDVMSMSGVMYPYVSKIEPAFSLSAEISL